MATSLRPEHRAQLDSIVQRMQANGESDAYIQGVVNDFTSKYGAGDSTAAGPAPRVAPSPAESGVEAPHIPTAGNPFGGLVIDNLPAIGGFLGGAATGLAGLPSGPGAFLLGMGGAGAGGAGGEALKQKLRGQELNPRDIALQGGLQGGLQGAGGLVVGAAGKVARPIMRRALGLGKAIQGKVKVGGRLVEDPVETALQNRLPATVGGVEKAGALRGQSAGKVRGAISSATQAGQTFRTSEITGHVKELLRSKVVPAKQKEAILTELRALYRDKGATLEPDLVQEIKRYYQRQARGIYKAGEEGAFTLADQPHGQFAEAMAQGSREALETIPGVAPANRQTQRLIGAEKALRNAVQRPAPPLQLNAPGTYPLVNLLAHRNFTSKVAVALADPRVQEALRQSPRAGAAAIQQMLLSAEPDATGGY